MSPISMQTFYVHLQRPLDAPEARLQGLARLSRLNAARIAAMTSEMAWESWPTEPAA